MAEQKLIIEAGRTEKHYWMDFRKEPQRTLRMNVNIQEPTLRGSLRLLIGPALFIPLSTLCVLSLTAQGNGAALMRWGFFWLNRSRIVDQQSFLPKYCTRG